MATGVINAANLLRGPGILYGAPLGTALPAGTTALAASATKFSNAVFGGAWFPLGSTAEGSEFSDSLSTDRIELAESLYAVAVVSTGREATWATNLAEINKTNLKAALNGGVSATTGVTGSEVTRVSAPTLGNEVRMQLGWQSEDDTIRFFGYQVLNAGSLSLAFRKGTDLATLSMEWQFEKPSATDPWDMFLAGAERAK